MSERNKQHTVRAADPKPNDPDRLILGEAATGLDPAEAAGDAREISRLLDESEGYDRPETGEGRS